MENYKNFTQHFSFYFDSGEYFFNLITYFYCKAPVWFKIKMFLNKCSGCMWCKKRLMFMGLLMLEDEYDNSIYSILQNQFLEFCSRTFQNTEQEHKWEELDSLRNFIDISTKLFSKDNNIIKLTCWFLLDTRKYSFKLYNIKIEKCHSMLWWLSDNRLTEQMLIKVRVLHTTNGVLSNSFVVRVFDHQQTRHGQKPGSRSFCYVWTYTYFPFWIVWPRILSFITVYLMLQMIFVDRILVRNIT